MFSFLAGLIFLVGFAAHIALTSKYVLTQRSFGNEVPRNTLRWNALYGIALLGLSVWGLVGLIDGRFFAPLAPLVASPAIVALSQIVSCFRAACWVRLPWPVRVSPRFTAGAAGACRFSSALRSPSRAMAHSPRIEENKWDGSIGAGPASGSVF